MAGLPKLHAAIAQARRPPAVTELRAGQRVRLRQLAFTVHHPDQPGAGTNEDSLVLQARISGQNFLWLGDLDKAGEEKMMARGALAGNVVKLGHHGAATSTSAALLAALRPQLGIISAGRNNRYGHPAPETLAALQQAGVPWLNTAEVGYIEYVGRPWGRAYWHTGTDWSTRLWTSPP